jgi:hypothetical protein
VKAAAEKQQIETIRARPSPIFLPNGTIILLTCGFQLGTIEPFGSELSIAGAGLAEVETGFQQAGLVRP